MVGESNLINAVNVANRISIPAQHQGRHGLFLLKLRHLLRKLLHLLVQFVRLRSLRGDRSVVVEHCHRTCQQHHSQNSLHHLLPAVGNLVAGLRIFGVGHEYAEVGENPGMLIFRLGARVCHGTEDDVQEVSKVSAEWQSIAVMEYLAASSGA